MSYYSIIQEKIDGRYKDFWYVIKLTQPTIGVLDHLGDLSVYEFNASEINQYYFATYEEAERAVVVAKIKGVL